MDVESLPRAAGDVIPSARARAAGLSAALLTARDSGVLVAVRRGVYVASAGRDELSPIVRHREMAFAVAQQRPGVVFAGITAAVLTGMPIVGGVPSDVVVLATGSSGRMGRPSTTIDRLRAAFDARLPFPGSRRVAAVLVRASSCAETPLETLSRLRIEELGFPPPELQLRVDRPLGRGPAFLDFAWPEHGVWGEADGGGKYLGNGTVVGARRSPAEIVHDEKERENDVRSVTKWACGRWEWDEAWHGGALRSILLRAGLPLVTAPRR